MFAVPVLSADVKLMTHLNKTSTTCKRSCYFLFWLADLHTQWCKITVLKIHLCCFLLDPPQQKSQILSYSHLERANKAILLEDLQHQPVPVVPCCVSEMGTPGSLGASWSYMGRYMQEWTWGYSEYFQERKRFLEVSDTGNNKTCI